MWKFPWGFKEGFTICAGLTITGIFLNLLVQGMPTSFLHLPFNLIIWVDYLILLIIFARISGKNKYLRWFSGHQAAITAIVSFLILVIILGFTRQLKAGESSESFHLLSAIGFSNMLHSWAFIFLMVYLQTL